MMRRWLGLMLLAWALALPSLRAEAQAVKDDPPSRPSHMPLGAGLENDLNPEQRLARRLLNQKMQDKETDEGFKKLVSKLLEDKDLLKSLDKTLSKTDINRLKENLGDFKDL